MRRVEYLPTNLVQAGITGGTRFSTFGRQHRGVAEHLRESYDCGSCVVRLFFSAIQHANIDSCWLMVRGVSLQALAELSNEEYLTMLKECGLVRERNSQWGTNQQFRLSHFQHYLSSIKLTDAENEMSNVTGFSERSYYLRLAKRTSNYCASTHD